MTLVSGFRVWDGNGNPLVTPSSRVGRLLGFQDLDVNAGGTITPAGSDQGTLFAIMVNNGDADTMDFNSVLKANPTITVTATTISWSWGGEAASARRVITLAYGVY